MSLLYEAFAIVADLVFAHRNFCLDQPLRRLNIAQIVVFTVKADISLIPTLKQGMLC